VTPYEFALVPIDRLKIHERFDPTKIAALADRIRRAGVFANPIWVARDSWVILNGHHRVEALRRLGAKRIPAWVFDYESDAIHVERWKGGQPMAKSEVVERSASGRPFPPKSTRHRVNVELPPRSVPLNELVD
jgi:L-serine kinase (ADP)